MIVSCRTRALVSNRNGFTLFETVLAVVILAIAIAPMLQAFGPALLATASEETTIVLTNYARQTLNRVAALDFTTLNDLVQAGQANPVDLAYLFDDGEESFTFKGTSYVPTVAITDASGGNGGLLEITTTISPVTLKTLKAVR